jgi:hypothetical protein
MEYKYKFFYIRYLSFFYSPILIHAIEDVVNDPSFGERGIDNLN